MISQGMMNDFRSAMRLPMCPFHLTLHWSECCCFAVEKWGGGGWVVLSDT